MNWLKVDSNAPITDELERWPAGAISLEGKELQDVLLDTHRSEIDAYARFNTPISESDFLPCEFRLVGPRHDEAAPEKDALDAYHDYQLNVTNLSKE